MILYDVPSRTACGLADETVARLAELPHIIGLKDAAGDAVRPARLRPLVGTKFRLLCGEDGWRTLLAQGGDGCISVTSNVAPGLCRNMYLGVEAWTVGPCSAPGPACRELTAALLRESNPVSGKACLSAARSYVARRPFAVGRIEQSTPDRARRSSIAHVRRVFGRYTISCSLAGREAIRHVA